MRRDGRALEARVHGLPRAGATRPHPTGEQARRLAQCGIPVHHELPKGEGDAESASSVRATPSHSKQTRRHNSPRFTTDPHTYDKVIQIGHLSCPKTCLHHSNHSNRPRRRNKLCSLTSAEVTQLLVRTRPHPTTLLVYIPPGGLDLPGGPADVCQTASGGVWGRRGGCLPAWWLADEWQTSANARRECVGQTCGRRLPRADERTSGE